MARCVTNVECISIEKRAYPTSHYVYILSVSWSDGVKHPIYRKFSSLFDFLALLKEEFKEIIKTRSDIILPELPTVSFFQWNWVGKDLVTKRADIIEEFCKKVIQLPKDISSRVAVLSFFETWDSDFCQIDFENRRSGRNSLSAKFSKFLDEHQLLKKFGRGRSVETKEEIVSGSGPYELDQNPYTELGLCASGVQQQSHQTDQSLPEYIATANFSKSLYNEADLLVGDKVTVIEKHLSGWWLVVCEKTNERGWAPGTFLTPADQRPLTLPNKKQKMPLGSFVTVCDYEAQNEEEISYKQGQTVIVLSTIFDGWFKVRIGDQTGFIPADHVRSLDRKPSQCPEHEDLLQFVNSTFKEPRKYWKAPPPRRSSTLSTTSVESCDIELKVNSPSKSEQNYINFVALEKFVNDERAENNTYFSQNELHVENGDFATGSFITEESSATKSLSDERLFDISDHTSHYSEAFNTSTLPRRKYSFSDISCICGTAIPDGLLDIDEDDDMTTTLLKGKSCRVSGSLPDNLDKPPKLHYTEVEFHKAISHENLIGEKSSTAYSLVVHSLPDDEKSEKLSQPILPPLPVRPTSASVEDTIAEGALVASNCDKATLKPVPAPRRNVIPAKSLGIRSYSIDDYSPPPVPEKTKLRKDFEFERFSNIHNLDQDVMKYTQNRPEFNRCASFSHTDSIARPPPTLRPYKPSSRPMLTSQSFWERGSSLKELSRVGRPVIKTAVVPPLMNITPTGFNLYPWYHGKLSGNETVELFDKYASEHHFLVRERRNGNGYALSVLHEGSVRHFPIDIRADGTYLFGKTFFRTLNDVVEFHMLNSLSKDKSWANADFHLIKPIPKRH